MESCRRSCGVTLELPSTPTTCCTTSHRDTTSFLRYLAGRNRVAKLADMSKPSILKNVNVHQTATSFILQCVCKPVSCSNQQHCSWVSLRLKCQFSVLDQKKANSVHLSLVYILRLCCVCVQAFTLDFKVHWGQHPLRPEFIESTYFLYMVSVSFIASFIQYKERSHTLYLYYILHEEGSYTLQLCDQISCNLQRITFVVRKKQLHYCMLVQAHTDLNQEESSLSLSLSLLHSGNWGSLLSRRGEDGDRQSQRTRSRLLRVCWNQRRQVEHARRQVSTQLKNLIYRYILQIKDTYC